MPPLLHVFSPWTPTNTRHLDRSEAEWRVPCISFTRLPLPVFPERHNRHCRFGESPHTTYIDPKTDPAAPDTLPSSESCDLLALDARNSPRNLSKDSKTTSFRPEPRSLIARRSGETPVFRICSGFCLFLIGVINADIGVMPSVSGRVLRQSFNLHIRVKIPSRGRRTSHAFRRAPESLSDPSEFLPLVR